LTRAITIIALICFLLAGVAAASILGRDSVPAARQEAATITQSPVSNKEAKKDRLAVVALALASFGPPPQTITLTEPLRQAFAATTDIEVPQMAPQAAPLLPSPKPKAAAKPAPQKSYALLSDVQIAGIKERLRLSSAQESYWPPVESALRAVARKIHATRQADPKGAPIDPDAAEVQQLKSAAMPLLFQLREDQKQEVRTLARIIGLEKVASQI
jgi:hypothetical protein